MMIFLDFFSHLESIRHAWILGNKKVDRIQKKSSNHGQISDQVGQKSDQVGQKSGYIPRSTNCPYWCTMKCNFDREDLVPSTFVSAVYW